ncbi:putative methyltransferase [Oenococcus oeni]|uniref:class I SAM-dependent DNA methyltransferase n=1 Tax=Oenococcus oeni TaxID=1247 RepID=UPI0010B6BEBB|nr:class I SAM-dependent methyltransferase [Oenococcus oeni]SYW04088.1 putative methyltransferase [Oenococcus oeni]
MNPNYSIFAELYDELFDPNMYLSWKGFVQDNSRNNRILDLAGGSGKLAVLLTKSGYQVSILDLSSQMLSLAKQRAENNNFSFDLFQANMAQNWHLNKRFPLISCFADSLNYLSNIGETKRTFFEVFNHLEKNGKFLFDVITPYQVNVVYRNYMYNNDDDPEKIFMWTSFPGDIKNSVDHDLKFFVYQEGIDAFKMVREVHHEQTYPPEKYLSILKEIGFRNIHLTSDFGRGKITRDTTRAFFVAEK